MKINTIAVMGLGYIGLPTAAMFASKKKHVIGIDIQQDVVDKINQGEIHIVEKDLDKMVDAAVKQGFLSASTIPQPADVFIITVPTPIRTTKIGKKTRPEPDLSYIKAAVKSLAKVLQKGNLVILESTSPVGTTEHVASWLERERPDLTYPHNEGDKADVNIAYCPERVLPGNILKELVENDRVIGGISNKCSERGADLYNIFLKGECLVTNARTAEMVKLTENSSRDVQIAFANELSIICDKLKINVWELIRLSNHHPRVNILQPGPGVGGHCIAVDPWFIVSETPEEAKLIRCAREVNDNKALWVIEKIKQEIIELNERSNAQNITIACYGLSFKANIGDLRESPAISIMKALIKNNDVSILAIEPNIKVIPSEINSVNLVSTKYAQENADIHVLLVDHKEFVDLDLFEKVLIDTRGIWVGNN